MALREPLPRLGEPVAPPGRPPEHIREKPYERADVRRATGGAIRPGGLTLTERALDLIPFAAGALLLDCGCGAGATLARLDDGGFCALGIDLSPLLAAEAALDEIARVLIPGGFCIVSDLYLRAGSPGCGGQGLGCAAGAVPRDVAEARLLRHGLTPVLFEDHTKLLVDLSCRLVFELGSAREVMAVLTGREPACDGTGEKPHLGYGLWIGRKEVSV